MSYKLIKGYFHLFYQSEYRFVGARPDGDSMWFKPNNPGHLTNLGGRDVDFNGGGFAQLRFEGIDALELHYKGSHQKVPECVSARDRLLQLAGFKDVTYAPSSVSDIDTSVRTIASPHPRKGYILSRNVDPYGRPVAFTFVGDTAGSDGSEIYLVPSMMARSLNAKLVGDGSAYPAYYTGLPYNLRDRLTSIAKKAMRREKGIWKVDVSLSGTQIADESVLKKVAQWPKLFRRLVSYFHDGNVGVNEFETWLREDTDRDDNLWIISRGEFGNMHDIVEVTGNAIKMVFSPEDIVISPR
jgi:endonuclease YncB( thermonuclease family)